MLAEDERLLMEVIDRCEGYGMQINISKTKAMAIGRKQKKIDMRTLNKWTASNT